MNETTSPWLNIRDAADYAGTGTKVLRQAIKSGRLKAARVGGRREIRLKREWIDQYFEDSTVPQ